MDLLTETFTAQTVALAAGVSAKQITDWCNQGQMVGHRDRLGKGKKREFTWYHVMEAAIAAELMAESGQPPAAAFAAAIRFSHTGDAPSFWVGEANDQAPERRPGFPYHYREGQTFLAVSGDKSTIRLSVDGALNINAVMREMGGVSNLIVVNVLTVFMRVMERMGRKSIEVLDDLYGEGRA